MPGPYMKGQCETTEYFKFSFPRSSLLKHHKPFIRFFFVLSTHHLLTSNNKISIPSERQQSGEGTPVTATCGRKSLYVVSMFRNHKYSCTAEFVT